VTNWTEKLLRVGAEAMDRYRGGFVGLPGSLWVGLDMFYAGWTLARTRRR